MFEFEAGSDKVLGVPTTEVFSAWGIEEGFYENVKTFVAKVDGEKPKGYFGAVLGKGVEDGDVLRGLLGWESVAAHGAAKAQEGGGKFFLLFFFLLFFGDKSDWWFLRMCDANVFVWWV